MKTSIPALFALLFFMPVPTPVIADSIYANDMKGILSYLAQCSPASYQFVQENVNTIRIINTDNQMNTGVAQYNPAGEIGISDLFFRYPSTLEIPGRWKATVAQLIIHEARHEWQYNYHWSLFLSSAKDTNVTQLLEQDASGFAAQVLIDCP